MVYFICTRSPDYSSYSFLFYLINFTFIIVNMFPF